MKIFAHRGASGHYPENTLLAYAKAIDEGAWGIELDAHYHPSGEFILLHDCYLESTTNGSGKYCQYSLEALKKLDAGAGEQIPTLDEALQFIAGKSKVNIELKSSSNNVNEMTVIIKTLKNLLIKHVNNSGFSWSDFVISSFNHLLLLTTKQMLPEISIGVLIASCPIKYASIAVDIDAKSINPSIECLNPELINDAHKNNIEVWVYTVDRSEDIAYCHQHKVDAIFTNFPQRSQQILNNLVNKLNDV
ncbi:glycerophosphodiester phosphodiesterase [Colwelliaceae bacterium 6471]